ncbi:MAG: cadherin-like domain-containing protein [Acidobacteria bacterium]|nr:cadherin-like domain-containing protein [Acidobacteriota bacterium]
MFFKKIAGTGRSESSSAVLSKLIAVVFLAALQLTGMPAPAAARDDAEPDYEDPSGGIPPTLPAYEYPVDGFDWKAEKRYYNWPLAWRERGQNKPWPQDTYHPEYINPSSWNLIVQGCQEENDFHYDLDPDREGVTKPARKYQWIWNGKSSPKSEDCYRYLSFPAEGHYVVKLKVFEDGKVETYEHPVEVKDYLIVVLGDSAASGEGAPDTPISGDHDGSNADWIDDRCHRSTLSGGAQAARRIEDASDKTSVTFISFACSGATLDTESWAWTSTEDPYEVIDYSPSRGTGITGGYVGIEPKVDQYGYFTETRLPAQTKALHDALTANGALPSRAIDTLIVAGGINDAKFANVAAVCVLFNDCRNESVGWEPELGDSPTLDQQFAEDVANIPAGWAKLGEQLAGFGIVAHKKLALEYPAFFEDDDGSQCEWIFGDVLAPIPGGWFWDEINHARNEWAPMLNDAVFDGATAPGVGFTFVSGISSGFDNHGMCADNRYINTANDAAANQGALDGYGGFFADMSSTGTAHPNRRGYSLYADRILDHVGYLTENSPPIGGSDKMWASLGLPLISNWMNVLDNDSDPDPDDTLSTRLETLPEHGTAELSLDGYLWYKPKPGYIGDDTLTYELTDGVFTRSVFVTITVTYPEIIKVNTQIGSTTEIGGLAGTELEGPYEVIFDRELADTRGSMRPVLDRDAIVYTAPPRRRTTKLTYTVVSKTTDRTSPSYGRMVRGKLILRALRR